MSIKLHVSLFNILLNKVRISHITMISPLDPILKVYILGVYDKKNENHYTLIQSCRRLSDLIIKIIIYNSWLYNI